MSMPVFCCNSYNVYRSLRDKLVCVTKSAIFGSQQTTIWIKASSRWSEHIDGQHNCSAFSLSRLKYFFFFFQLDSHFFLSTLILKSRLVFFFFIREHMFCKSRLIIFITFRVFYKFRLSGIMFSTCFYYRYNFVLNGTSYHNLETDWSEKNHLPIKYLSKWIPINCNVSHVIL